MTVVTRFDTPGRLSDVPQGAEFYDTWHALIDGMLGPDEGGQFYNASRTDVDPIGERSLVWLGFPRRLLVTEHRDDRMRAFELGDDRGDTELGLTTQTEYLEWRVERNAGGKITKVTFTTETPEYWQKLFEFDPDTVVHLYRTLVGDNAVVEADLRDDYGLYNPRNGWNTTDGIVHYIVNDPANTLNAAIGLAKLSVGLGGPVHDSYELQSQIREATSADPRVKYDVSAVARQPGRMVTLREPIGLYIAGWDDSGWTAPNGSPVGNYWNIVRGRMGAALRVEYAVPKAAGFAVGDIRIGGRHIEFGGQIAEHVTVMIGGIAGTRHA